jgi:ribosome-binding factor A
VRFVNAPIVERRQVLQRIEEVNMPSPLRLQRIADRIREELSEMVVMQVSDPRLSGVSIEGHERAPEILKGLEHASGFLRRQLAGRIELRVFPKLRFHWDPTPERADHIERILAELRQQQPPPTQEIQPSDDE